MVNWKDNGVPFENFNEKITQEWIDKKFEYDECREWITIGLTLYEAKLAAWLRDIKSQDIEDFAEPNWVKVNADLEQLREEFANQEEESDEGFKSPEEEEIYEEKINAQDWLEQNYPQEERKSTKELHITENLKGELDLSEFTNLEKIYISYWVKKDKLEIKDKEKYEDKIVKLVNAQEYLEKYLKENYPEKKKSEIENLNFDNKNLEGELDLSGFTNLTRLDCDNNKLKGLNVNDCQKLETICCQNSQISGLVVSDCPHLKNVYCGNNQLTNIDYSGLNPEKLTSLYIYNNNFSEQDLTVFSQFTNLQTLYIYNDNKERIEKGDYNHFTGSLESLKNLNKLTELNVSNTNIDKGLEYLPESVGTLTCEVISNESNFQVSKIRKQLVPCDNNIAVWRESKKKWEKVSSDDFKRLMEADVKVSDYNFINYLEKEDYKIFDAGEEDIKKKYKEYRQAQTWLDFNYPKDKRTKENELDISNKDLEGDLNLTDFTGLENLNCSNNQLTSLNLDGLTQLERLACNDNLLTEINYSALNPNELTHLDISNNNLPEKDLSEFKNFVNLEELRIGNDNEKKIKEGEYNCFAGSLESLSKLNKLKILNINNTDVDNGLDSLPESVKEIYCSSKERSGSRISNISELLREKTLDFAFSNDGKCIRLVNAQQWLNENFPHNGTSKLSGYEGKKKEEIIELNIEDKLLGGSLKLEGFNNLEKLYCDRNYLTDINSLLSELSPEKLKELSLYDNNFSESDLTPFSRFVSLESLIISGNLFRKDYEQGITNRFTGSLQPLQNLTKLKSLFINSTDIDSGLEYLPEDLENLYCTGRIWGTTRPGAKVEKIFDQLRDYGEDGNYDLSTWKRNKKWQDKFDKQEFNHEFKEWKKVGLKANEVDFAAYLEIENCSPSDINEESKKEAKLKEYRCVQRWLDRNYPEEERESVKVLKIAKQGLEGKLNLSGFTNLEKLDCNDNLIDDLNFSSLDSNNLTYLDISNNKLSQNGLKKNESEGLSVLGDFKNLKILKIGNDDKKKIDKEIYNHFSGSLDFLKELTKLESLHISNTDINEVNIGIDDLSKSMREIDYSIKERSESKLKEIKKKLDSYQKEIGKRSASENKKQLDKYHSDKTIKTLSLGWWGLKGHLDLSEYKDIEELDISNNQLTSIDIGKNTKLKKLNCSNNKLIELNLENNINLEELNCSDNELESLSLQGLSNLISLDCRNNSQLKSLEGIEECNKLSSLEFANNKSLNQGLLDKLDKIVKTNKLKEQWKKKDAEDWLNKEYPENDKCLGKFDWENKGKTRSQIKELDIGGEELTGKLKLNGFSSLRHLICRDNQLESIDLTGCEGLEIINCEKNKLEKINFGGSILKLKEFRGSSNKFTNLENITNCIDKESLTYFNINDNNVSDGKIINFNKFTNLKILFIGNVTTKEEKLGCFKDSSLENLKDLKGLQEVDIRNNGIKIDEKFLEGLKNNKENSPFVELEKIYYTFGKDKPAESPTGSGDKMIKAQEEIKKIKKEYYYDEENKFFDLKSLRSKKTADDIEIKVILKTPLLSGNKKHKSNIVKDSYDENRKADYYEKGKLIYPSEKETGFRWETGESLSLSDLPLRLCHISNKMFELFSIKKYFEKNDIELVSLKDESLTVNYNTKEKKETFSEGNITRELQEIKNYLQKNKEEIIKEQSLYNKGAEIAIKKRVECDNEAKHYAILSYSWGGKHKEEIPWSPENAEKRLSRGGVKSLDKAIETLKVLNEFHSLGIKGKEISHLWMDQLCVNQDNPKEKGHEVSKMRDYYGNATVTLIAIHAEVGEENIKRLLKSFDKGESGLIYPNEVIENSLPILEKIIGSEWFSRSWTFQEGFLSKRTIFMFDDFLIDGRFMALIWKLKQFSSTHYEECRWMKDLCEEKIATPVGWVYYEGENKKGHSLRDKASLRLNEALWAVKNRGRALPIDGIYSIIGLLPYSDKVRVDYDKDPESVLREVMLIAVNHSHGTPLAWSGWGSRKSGLCWVPAIDESGSSSVTGGIKVDYKFEEEKLFEPSKGIKIQASEYVISKKSSGLYEVEMREAMEGSLWMREVWVKVEGKLEKLTLSGTKEGIEAVSEGRLLLIPNREVWKSDVKFAILALKIKNDDVESKLEKIEEELKKLKKETDNLKKQNVGEKLGVLKNQVNICHRIDLLRIEEGWENLVTKDEKGIEKTKVKEKQFIIGLDNQQYQAQIEIPPKK